MDPNNNETSKAADLQTTYNEEFDKIAEEKFAVAQAESRIGDKGRNEYRR